MTMCTKHLNSVIEPPNMRTNIHITFELSPLIKKVRATLSNFINFNLQVDSQSILMIAVMFNV